MNIVEGGWDIVIIIFVIVVCFKVYWFCFELFIVLVFWVIVKYVESFVVGEWLVVVVFVIVIVIFVVLIYYIWVLFESWILCWGFFCVVG